MVEVLKPQGVRKCTRPACTTFNFLSRAQERIPRLRDSLLLGTFLNGYRRGIHIPSCEITKRESKASDKQKNGYYHSHSHHRILSSNGSYHHLNVYWVEVDINPLFALLYIGNKKPPHGGIYTEIWHIQKLKVLLN